MQELTPYQQEIARAVLDSVINDRGLTFTVEIARGGGVRELSAQIERLLLTLHVNDGARLLRVAPPGAGETRERIVDSLSESGLEGLWSSESKSVRFGRSTLRFMKTDELGPTLAEPTFAGVGLIEVADAQMVPADVFDLWIEPLIMESRATTVLYGRPLNSETRFEAIKQRNREAEQRDGVQRHFRVCADQVAEAFESYGQELADAEARLGAEHPEFQNAYLLRPVVASSPLFSGERLRAAEEGSRAHAPGDLKSTVASVVVTRLPDVANVPAALLLNNPSANAVVTIGESDRAGRLRVIEHRWLQAVDAATLAKRVGKVLGEWRPERTVAEDRSGVEYQAGAGEGFRSLLERSVGFAPIAWVRADEAKDAERLSGLIAAIHTGRLTVYRGDGSTEQRMLRQELEAASVRYGSGGLFQVDLPAGDEGFLRGLTLIARTGAVVRRPREIAETALAS
ncbi:MAG: hypothetical protein O3B65_02435 [Chloroflexi bacterium]|nr:hypothetical protein [Chloroflexota bacterium]